MTSSVAALDEKIHLLQGFIVNLRKGPANPWNVILADAVEALLRIGSSEEIEKAFELCECKFPEVAVLPGSFNG